MSDSVFLTGATGFVGSALARLLQTRGYKLKLLVRPGANRANIGDIDAEIVTGDLLSPDSYSDALQGCRYLFHVAADYRLWVPNPKAMLQANVEGTRDLMLAALKHKVERIIYCSSVAALGHGKDGQAADETTPVFEDEIIGIYKRSKYRAEQEVLRLIAEQQLPAVIVNPSTPIGPCDIKPTPTGEMIRDVIEGRMPAYVDTGLNIVHVDDVAQGHLLALEKGSIGEKYILGGENLMLNDLFARIAEVACVKAPSIRLRQSWLWPVALVSEGLAHGLGISPRVTRETLAMSRKKMFFSSLKAQNELDYAPRAARDAIVDAVAWFRANPKSGNA